MCGKNATTTTQTSPNPAAMGNYMQLLQGAQNTVLNNPWQSYGGEFVAPINEQQFRGIGNINQYAESAQPIISEAEMLARSGSTPISAADIQNYYNPYQKNVIDATEAQFQNMNAQQQQQVIGNAAAQNALGGDRVGVAQANLAGQQQLSQAPVIAGLENQGFSQAAQLALAAKQQQAQGAYSLGNLGVAGQQAGLTGAGAQIGAGTLEQQNKQALNDALYRQFLMQQAFPYQQWQWLAGIDTGVGSQMGGTSSTTGPPPNWLAQLFGLGTAGVGAGIQAGAFKPGARGGRMEYDGGGGVPYGGHAMPYSGVGYLPTMQLTRGPGAPKPPGISSGADQMAKDAQAIANGFKMGQFGKTSSPSFPSTPDSSDEGADFAYGGGVHRDFGGSVTSAGFGGSMMPMWRRGYDEGGPVDIIPDIKITPGSGPPAPPKIEKPQGGSMPSLPLGQIISGVGAALGSVGSAAGSALGGGEAAGEAGAMLAVLRRGGPVHRQVGGRGEFDPAPVILPDGTVDHGTVVVDPEDAPATSLPEDLERSRREREAAMVLARAAPPAAAPDPGAALPFAPTAGVGATPAPPAATPSVYDRIREKYANGVPTPAAPLPSGNNLGLALMAAGFGMMASRSPYAGVGIGQGALTGLQTYESLGREQRAEAMKQQEIGRRVDEMMLHAEQAQKNMELATRPYEQMTAAQKATLAETQRHRQMEEAKPVVLGQQQVYDPYTGQTKTIQVYGVRGNPAKGQDATKYYDPTNPTKEVQPIDRSTVRGATSALPKVTSKKEYDLLPSGAVYVAPDGSTRTKP